MDLEDEATTAHLLKCWWGGHVARMDQENWALATTVWDPRTGRRNRGWPRHRWSQEMKIVRSGAKRKSSWKKLITFFLSNIFLRKFVYELHVTYMFIVQSLNI